MGDMNLLASAVDNAIEALVLPSFTRTGYDIRRRLFAWDATPPPSLTGRTILLTGPTSGIGREAAAALAGMGARLVLVGRSADKLEGTRRDLASATGNEALATYVADLSSLASVRRAAEEILAGEPRIDVVVDNAGAMFAQREETDEGFERSLATMVLGPFVLVSRLLPRLLASDDGRLVAVTSGGMYTQRLHLDDLNYERGDYGGPQAYARAKRAQVVLIREWARRLASRGVVANVMHPGWVDTPGVADALPGFYRRLGDQLRTPQQGADTIVWLASSPEARRTSGRLFLDRRVRPFDRIPSTRVPTADRRELWSRVLHLTREPDPTAG